MKEKELITKAVKMDMPDEDKVLEACVNQDLLKKQPISRKKHRIRPLVPVAAGIVLGLIIVATIPQLRNRITGDNDRGDSVKSGKEAVNEEGIYINPVELPKENGVTMDMIGLVVYKGKVYTQDGFLECDEATKKALVGEYLGTASGTIDEWSKDKEYQKEFASSVPGDVYTVNGYDKSFRICIPEMNGMIAFYSNLNDLRLKVGKELYGDRLNLIKNYVEVTYQTHDDWDNGRAENHSFDKETQEDMQSFLEDLYQSPFVDLGDSNMELYESKQVHLYFKMKDGTTQEVRLFEGGYVSYSYMGGVCVKMQGKPFEKIFEAGLK